MLFLGHAGYNSVAIIDLQGVWLRLPQVIRRVGTSTVVQVPRSINVTTRLGTDELY